MRKACFGAAVRLLENAGVWERRRVRVRDRANIFNKRIGGLGVAGREEKKTDREFILVYHYTVGIFPYSCLARGPKSGLVLSSIPQSTPRNLRTWK